MSPRTGRPKVKDPRSEKLNLRINAEDKKKIDFCAQFLGITPSEVVRRGVDRLYKFILAGGHQTD